MKNSRRTEDLSNLAEGFDIPVTQRVDASLAKIAARIEKEVAAGRMTLEEAHERLTQSARR